MCADLPADDEAAKAAAMGTSDDESQPPADKATEEMPSVSEQPQEGSSDIADVEPAEDTDTTAAAAAGTEEVSAGVAMDTGATAGATASTDEYPSELPFQVQITYTDLDGAEAVRVLTQTQPVTRDRQQAETSTSLCSHVLDAPHQTPVVVMVDPLSITGLRSWLWLTRY